MNTGDQRWVSGLYIASEGLVEFITLVQFQSDPQNQTVYIFILVLPC